MIQFSLITCFQSQMPGVNVPWSQVLYYLVTLTISGVFHEFGHAISAVRYVFVVTDTSPTILLQTPQYRSIPS